MKIVLRLTLIIAMVCSLAFNSFASSYSLSLSPANITGNVGDTVSIDVNLLTEFDVIAADFNIVFDGNILEYKSLSNILNGIYATDTEGPVPPITFSYMNPDPLLAGEHRLATIDFIIKQTTSLATELSFDLASESYFGIVDYNTGEFLPGSSIGATIEITQGNATVPEAPSLWLVGIGIVSMIFVRRRVSR